VAKQSKYVVISNNNQFSKEPTWEVDLKETIGICHTCAKAYEIGLFLAGITRPEQTYRKILETVKRNGAATLSQRDGSAAATIVVIKIY
jgi:hypothetical protein